MWYRPDLNARIKGAHTINTSNSVDNSDNKSEIESKKSDILSNIIGSSQTSQMKAGSLDGQSQSTVLSAGPSTFVTGRGEPDLLEGNHKKLLRERRTQVQKQLM